MGSAKLGDFIDKFNSFTQKPVKFLSVQEDLKDDIKNLVKSLYDFTKVHEKGENKVKKSTLPELIVEDFDEEQIWQQIDLQNSECWDDFVWEVANCMSNKTSLEFPVEIVNEEQSDEEVEHRSEESHEMEMDDENEVTEKPKKKKETTKSKGKKSIVDDKFFNLKEMENFLLREEKNEEKNKRKEDSESDDDSIDMFEDIDDEDDDDEEGGKEVKYNDFFDREDGQYEEEAEDESEEEQETEVKPKKKEKQVKFADLMHDDESENESGEETSKGKTIAEEKKSDFELRQQRLQQTITRLEEKTLKEASWQLKGEVDATKRPQNSLLQEVVDFDLTSRPPPLITEETTLTLEDIIRRRIKDKAWDDVVRKEKPVDDQLLFRKPEILDHSKSKLSLAQVYEQEYLKQKKALSGEVDESEPENVTQVRDAMSKLFSKLDALCHYHYTPKAPTAEVKIVSNTPAISMEEVAPVATSDAALLAPEEVKRKRKGELMSKDERTQTDKNRERRRKKKLQRSKGQVMKVTNNRNTTKAVEGNNKSLKTSKAFFQQLNDDASSLIKNKKRNVKNKGQ